MAFNYNFQVVCIFGVSGACRTDEFLHINMSDVQKQSESLFLVRLTQTKTKVIRSFTISGDFAKTVQKYINLRPADAQNRFFLNYQRGKCTQQFIGRNKFSSMPRRIAEFLQLPNPERFKGILKLEHFLQLFIFFSFESRSFLSTNICHNFGQQWSRYGNTNETWSMAQRKLR